MFLIVEADQVHLGLDTLAASGQAPSRLDLLAAIEEMTFSTSPKQTGIQHFESLHKSID